MGKEKGLGRDREVVSRWVMKWGLQDGIGEGERSKVEERRGMECGRCKLGGMVKLYVGES